MPTTRSQECVHPSMFQPFSPDLCLGLWMVWEGETNHLVFGRWGVDRFQTRKVQMHLNSRYLERQTSEQCEGFFWIREDFGYGISVSPFVVGYLAGWLGCWCGFSVASQSSCKGLAARKEQGPQEETPFYPTPPLPAALVGTAPAAFLWISTGTDSFVAQCQRCVTWCPALYLWDTPPTARTDMT